MRVRTTITVLLASLLLPAAAATAAPAPAVPPALTLQRVASGLSFPTWAGTIPGTGRLLVLERGGRVRVRVGTRFQTVLDLRRFVSTRISEQGLLGIAFHPRFASPGPYRGVFYLHYVGADGDDIVDRYVLRGLGIVPGSRVEVLRTPLIGPYHHGGAMAFGRDGKLYIGFGDGAPDADNFGNAQNPATLRGKLLRLDVATLPYLIPPSNPFVGLDGARAEVWAMGLRNPWRFSFDRLTGDLWLGDVGNQRFEEIDRVPYGRQAEVLNFEWPAFEGVTVFKQGVELAGTRVPPLLTWAHGRRGCAVVGGHVYRGRRIPALRGWYVYGDFCSTRLRLLKLAADGTIAAQGSFEAGLPRLTSMAEGAGGELYAIYSSGEILTVVAAPTPPAG
jgi:glucose/arabinose dehydrogenase